MVTYLAQQCCRVCRAWILDAFSTTCNTSRVNAPGSLLSCVPAGGKSLTVLVDEAGAIYKEDVSGSSQFWADLKAFSAGPSLGSTPHAVRVVLAAAYGSKRSAADITPPIHGMFNTAMALGNDSSSRCTGLQPASPSPTWAATALPTPQQQTVSAGSGQLNAQQVHQAAQQPMATQAGPISVMQPPQQQQAVQPVTPRQQLPPQPTSTLSSPTKTPVNPDDPVAVITVLPPCRPDGVSLQLAAEEYEELWSSFNAHSHLELRDEVKDYIWRITGGQVRGHIELYAKQLFVGLLQHTCVACVACVQFCNTCLHPFANPLLWMLRAAFSCP